MHAAVLALLLAAGQPVPDTVVVCPEAFREALRPWLAYRTRQGHSLAVLSNTEGAREIRRRIRRLAKAGRLKFVVLVGDAEPDMATDPAVRKRCVPIHLAKAEVNVLWGSEPQIATDNYYADLDDDQIPEVAVGRLTADRPAELERIVAKIIAYERSADVGPWRRRLNFVAGIGGFGRFADVVLETATKHFLTEYIPAGYRVSMTYASWPSPYCPDPRTFGATTLERLNEGSWFWVYLGHGQRFALDRVRVPGRTHHILSTADVPKLECRSGGPIALFLACYAGAIDARSDCLAEEMLRRPGGPVAVVAGSRVTMPYAMAVLGTGLMDQCFRRHCPTLGQALLRAKQDMMKRPEQGDRRRAMLDGIAKAISPAPNRLAAERAEHLLLLNLIGDPMLRLRHPKEVKLKVPPIAAAGGPLNVSGTSPVDGRGKVELVVRRDRLTFKPPAREKYPQTPGELARFQEVYERANDRRLASADVAVEGGRFAARLDVPQNARGTCHVRVFVEGTEDFALGAAVVKIAKEIGGRDLRDLESKLDW